MMQQTVRPLPKQVDAVRHAQQGLMLSGSLAVSDLPRLAAVLGDTTARLFPELRFGLDDEGHRVAHCQLQGQLQMQCQRCLEPMLYELDAQLDVAFVASDVEAARLPTSLEPVLLIEGSSHVDVYSMLEDELLLSLPMAPVHAHCERSQEMAGEVGQDRAKPFAGLAALLGQSTTGQK